MKKKNEVGIITKRLQGIYKAKKEAKLIHLTHKYTTAHFPGLLYNIPVLINIFCYD
jgi:hypothetical protein